MRESIEARSGELMSIPVSRLVPSAHNARKTNGEDVQDLVASIRAQGVLQNLIVCPVHDRKGRPTGDYEVVGGGRRLRALKLLVAAKEIGPDEEVLCRVKESRAAAEASLAENVVREAMHPADEFDAFRALAEQGASPADIASRFGVSALTVRRRLKLADLHPQLIELYRAGEATLEQLMALTVSDDRDEQLRVWEGASPWHRNPSSLRAALVAAEVDASSDPLARLVGLDAYEAAGGKVRRDLFDDEAGGYIQDAALLARLADEKLCAASELVRDEGWGWVEVQARLGASEVFRFGRLPKVRRELKRGEAKRLEALRKQADKLESRLEAHYEGADDGLGDEEVRALERDAEAARDAAEDFEKSLESWPVDAMQGAGAIVSVGRDGQIEVHRGLVRREDRPPVEGESSPADGVEAQEAPPPARATHSAALMVELTAQRTLAARAAMLDKPRVALVVLLHALVQRLLGEAYVRTTTAVRLVPSAQDAGLSDPGLQSSKAAERLRDATVRWGERIPGEPARLLGWLIGLADDDRAGLLALCVALTLNDVGELERASPLDEVATALSLDMADWWEATAVSYFSRVRKDTILAAVEEGAGPEAVGRMRGVSKAELARLAERELAGKRWLPGPLRSAQGEVE